MPSPRQRGPQQGTLSVAPPLNSLPRGPDLSASRSQYKGPGMGPSGLMMLFHVLIVI